MKQEAIAKFEGINIGRNTITLVCDTFDKENEDSRREIHLSDYEYAIVLVEFPRKAHSFFIKNNTDYQLNVWLCDDTNDERVHDDPLLSGQEILPRTAEEIYISEDNDSECYKKVVGFILFTDVPYNEIQFNVGDFITIQGEDIYVKDNEKIYITTQNE